MVKSEVGEVMRKLLVMLALVATIFWAMPAMAEDCVDMELGARVITSDPL